jgi:hypothetical protein
MSKKQMKAVYDSLIASGDLLELYPELTGTWKLDQEDFKLQYSSNKDTFLGDFEYESGYEY